MNNICKLHAVCQIHQFINDNNTPCVFFRPVVVIWKVPSADHDYVLNPVYEDPVVDLTESPVNIYAGLDVLMLDAITDIQLPEELVSSCPGKFYKAQIDDS